MPDPKETPETEDWHLIGLLSSFNDIQDNERSHVLPGCKTLSVPKADRSRANRLSDLDEQVLVFKYKGFLHAVDNAHSVFPFW